MALKVAVIGAGPAGMTAALCAAEHGAETVLLERGERVGRKLLLTGNGKCNFTNLHLDAACYHADADSFEMKALERFGVPDSVAFLRSLGIEPMEKRGGYLYPRSGQAASVLTALRNALSRAGVRTVTACTIRSIRRKGNGFQILTDQAMFPADRLILATGSSAGPGTQEAGSGYAFAERFGHRIETPLPALCGLCCAEKDFFKTAAGVRTDGRISLYLEEHLEESAEGELQLTSYGVSGIPAFQLSRTVSRALSQGRRAELSLSFLQECEDASELLKGRAAAGFAANLEALGNGLLNKNLWSAILKRAGLKPGASPAALSGAELSVLSGLLTDCRFRVIRTNDFKDAQTVVGGVDTSEVDPVRMESRLIPGLHFAGEMLNVDGICGGYNLQWCWTSGTLAGISAAEG